MKISWQKIGLVVGMAVLLVGMFANFALAAEGDTEVETKGGGFIRRYKNVPTLDEAVRLASNFSSLEKIAKYISLGLVEKETITKGKYSGTAVLVNANGQLCTVEFVKVPPSWTPHRITVGKDNKTVYLEDGEPKLKYTKSEAVTDPEKLASNVADNIVSNAMKALSVVLATIQLAIALFLQWLMIGLDLLLNAGNILKNGGVQDGWTAVRNLCNMFFILILLAIAFMTVFMGTEGSSYSVKRALPMLVIAVLAINFSFLICRVMVEGADIASRSFVTEGEAGVLGDIMGVKKLGNITLPATSEYGKTFENAFGVGEGESNK
jgi:uncharacterized membrane protein (DUF485 family)